MADFDLIRQCVLKIYKQKLQLDDLVFQVYFDSKFPVRVEILFKCLL